MTSLPDGCWPQAGREPVVCSSRDSMRDQAGIIVEPLRMTPEEMGRWCGGRWSELTEDDLGKAHAIVGGAVAESPELHLLYAMRIAKPVAEIGTLKTLIKNWNATHSGAGGSGLERGRASANHMMVSEFLEKK